jgi:hypothetical protein
MDVTRSPSEREDRVLKQAAALFVAGSLAHYIDHVVMGLSATPTAVLVSGLIGTLPAALAIVLVMRSHPWGPLLAAVTGIPFAVGYAAVHLPPYWGGDVFSQPLAGHSIFDWLAVAVAIAGGLALGLTGLYAMRVKPGAAVAAPAPTQG